MTRREADDNAGLVPYGPRGGGTGFLCQGLRSD